MDTEIQIILMQIEQLYSAYRIPSVTIKHGNIEVEYEWTSPTIEEIYKQKVMELADLSMKGIT